jgi:cytochrome c peroxidase
MNIPIDNPLTVEGVELGRKLFYEELLSGDNTQSCASCHSPAAAFSDPNQFSTGIQGIQGTRNSMALINLGWNNFFFWDGRSKTLEEQVLIPVRDQIEMHNTWTNAVTSLESRVEYRNMFFKAFGEEGIDSTKAAKALAQFLRTMISGSSKYDVMYKYENGYTLNAKEQQVFQTVSMDEWQGYSLFKSLDGADCFHCHNGALMQVLKFSNNGLDASFSDLGRGAITGNPADNGKFKVPTLRNIALSAPYMHDGRFSSLEEVVDHYSFGIQNSSTIDPLIEFAFQGGVQLNPTQRAQLIAFLNTMTDWDFVTNPAFQDPD